MAPEPAPLETMETTFYYTFSTIAQSIAAAMGLIGAFVLFRLESVNAQIEEATEKIIRYLDSTSYTRAGLDAILALNSYSDVLEMTKDPVRKSGNPNLTSPHYKLEVLLQYEASVKSKLRLSLWLTGSLLVMSIVALCLTPTLARRSFAGMILLFAVIWVGGCLFSYGVLIKHVLRSAMSGAVGRWARASIELDPLKASAEGKVADSDAAQEQ